MSLKYNTVSSGGNYYRPTPYLYASGSGVAFLPCILYKCTIINIYTHTKYNIITIRTHRPSCCSTCVCIGKGANMQKGSPASCAFSRGAAVYSKDLRDGTLIKHLHTGRKIKTIPPNKRVYYNY